jgi:hypothetical protein
VQVGQRIYDNKHIHRSRRGELMISKSEVIIANELNSAGIVYEYERPFIGQDRTRRYPDFTIEDADTGTTWFWEHLGMLGDAEYEIGLQMTLKSFSAQERAHVVKKFLQPALSKFPDLNELMRKRVREWLSDVIRFPRLRKRSRT